jgi:hypothetical protein
VDAQARAADAETRATDAHARAADADTRAADADARARSASEERDALAAAVEAERERVEAERRRAEAEHQRAEAERQRVAEAEAAGAERAAGTDAERATAEQRLKDAEARTAKAGEERDALSATLEVAQMEATATKAAADARLAEIAAERETAVRNWQEAEARAEEANIARDELTALLDAAKESVQGMHAAVETRLAAIETKRTRTAQAWEESEARARDAIRARDELAAELETVKKAVSHDPETAERLAAATERIRVLELQLFERDRGEKERDVELGPLIDAKPSPPSELAGKRATRHVFKPTPKVKIDREAGLLVDLSVTGAQVICANSPDVGQIITLSLLSEEVPCFCQGRLLWARREQPAKGKPFRYRAGIAFTSADEVEIEAFIKHHAVS